MKVLYFLEEKSHIDIAIELKKKYSNSNSVFISLDPTSTHFLSLKGIEHKTPESYFDNNEIEQMKTESHDYVLKKIEQIDRFLLDTYPQMNHIKPARYHYINLCTLLNIIPSKIRVLDKIISAEKPDKIIYFKSNIKDEGGDQFIKESTWVLALSNIIREVNLNSSKIESLEEFGIEFHDPKLAFLSANIKRRITGNYLEKIERKLLKVKEYFFYKKYYNLNLLFLTVGYELEYLICDLLGLRKYSVGLYLWDLDKRKLGTVYNLRCKKNVYNFENAEETIRRFYLDTSLIWEQIINKDSFRDIFTIGKFNYFHEIQNKLQFIFTHNLAEIFFVNYTFPLICKKFNIKAVISNDCYLHLRQAVFYHNERNIPMIHFYHGPCYTHRTDYNNYCWWKSSEINFMFGEAISELARQHNPNAKYISIGSLSIDKVPVTKPRKVKNKIIYIFNKYNGNNFTFWSGVYYPENTYYYYQSRIINKLLEYPQYDITLKLHPNFDYKNPPMIESLMAVFKKRKIKIIKNAYYARELILDSDLVILDMPQTSLLQAIKAGKPVLLFSGLGYVLDEPIKKLVKKCAEYSEDIEEFISVLDKYLKDVKLWNAPDNDEFLRKCGTHLNDGKSCIRATQTILSIVKERNSKA